MILIHFCKSQSFTRSLTLDKLGFWEYLARFSLDKFINGPSGLVNMEAWRNSETKNHSKCFMLFNSPYMKITHN